MAGVEFGVLINHFRFYVGGNIYNRLTVPDTFKNYDSQHADPERSTASIFTFTW